MSSYTLDDIRAAADKAYGSTDIEVDGVVCHLINPIRLPKERRDALLAKQGELDVDEDDTEAVASVDQYAVLADCIRIIAGSKSEADALLAACDGDLGMLMAIFDKYNVSEEAGEASASVA